MDSLSHTSRCSSGRWCEQNAKPFLSGSASLWTLIEHVLHRVPLLVVPSHCCAGLRFGPGRPPEATLQHNLHMGPFGSDPSRRSTPSKRQWRLQTQQATSKLSDTSPTTLHSRISRTSSVVNPTCSPSRKGPDSARPNLSHCREATAYDSARDTVSEAVSQEPWASSTSAPPRRQSRTPHPQLTSRGNCVGKHRS